MVSSMIEVYVCMCGRGGDQQFSVYYLFILNFPTLNCLQFKPKLFSFSNTFVMNEDTIVYIPKLYNFLN